MNPINVSVGVAAYNEEKNIARLLAGVLNQKQLGWKLKEILVYCDGCTDNTVIYATEAKSRYVKVFDDKKRRGKSYRIGQVFKKFSSEILVLFDADLELSGRNVITKLVSGFEDLGVMLVSGNPKPFSPKNFIQEGIYSTHEVFYESRIKMRGGNNIFGCQGGCLAVRRVFAKKVNHPDVISGDAYLYLECITKGFKFKYIDDAVVYYKLANNLADYLKQLFRATPQSVSIFLSEYFGDKVKQEFRRPLLFYSISIAKAFIKRPLPTIFIIIINFLAKPFIPFMTKKYVAIWPTALSTK